MSIENNFIAFGIDLEVAVIRTKDFMLRLLGSGVNPSYVSLEGFRYAKDLITAYEIKLPHESLRGDVASVIIEEAAQRSGIHSDQLRAKREQKG